MLSFSSFWLQIFPARRPRAIDHSNCAPRSSVQIGRLISTAGEFEPNAEAEWVAVWAI
jgi:hypothetical protein